MLKGTYWNDYSTGVRHDSRRLILYTSFSDKKASQFKTTLTLFCYFEGVQKMNELSGLFFNPRAFLGLNIPSV